ncbi:hypothetical protein [Pseudoalteromonas denitrificans]|uniref:Uncharacterized protein n=1 Tax=Pseudoalteromonas denitrificans DSM 6059 TaxID=1123010 RepID=A0A1I1RM06_9GAMM|nr:hypothetical protein [Pseudoalteromonas denitrificans]SFD35047.1 hypothetical protein SAMN02745724_04280 [Pseudoalteromonas denitrificans DSM 6059]
MPQLKSPIKMTYIELNDAIKEFKEITPEILNNPANIEYLDYILDSLKEIYSDQDWRITKSDSNDLRFDSDHTTFGYECEFAQVAFSNEDVMRHYEHNAPDVRLNSGTVNLFHADLAKQSIGTKYVGMWDLGSDYENVIELGTPALKWDRVWNADLELVCSGEAFKRMYYISLIFDKYLSSLVSIKGNELLLNRVGNVEAFQTPLTTNSAQLGTVKGNRESNKLKSHNAPHKKLPGDARKSPAKTFGLLRDVFTKTLFNGSLEEKSGASFSTVDESVIKAKHMTLNPEEVPLYLTKEGCNEKYISKGLIENTILSRGFIKNGVRLRAPQYTMTVPAEVALELIEEGVNVGQQFNSPYLERLNELHLGFRKYFTSKEPQLEKMLCEYKGGTLGVTKAKIVARQAITILSYFLTTVCGKPAEVSAEIRRETKFAGLKGDALIQALNNYRDVYPDTELKCWCYTHSWIKDVAHVWFKCDPIEFIRLLCRVDINEANAGQDNGAYQSIRIYRKAFTFLLFSRDWNTLNFDFPTTDNNLTNSVETLLKNGDIGAPLEELANKMEYDMDSKRFINTVLNKLSMGNKLRSDIYKKYQYNLSVTLQAPKNLDTGNSVAPLEFAKSLFKSSGLKQTTHVLAQAIFALTHYSEYAKGDHKKFQWCRGDTYATFNDNYKTFLQKKAGMVIVELRDEAFLEHLAMGSIDDEHQGG